MKTNPELYTSISSEIEEMLARDQEIREKYRETKEWDFEIDVQNTKRAKEIIEEIGWPTISKVGVKSSHLFWFLIQHADQEPEFQKQCLDVMKSLPKEEVNQEDIGYLEDRVRRKDGKLQLYGTQFGLNSETGEYGPFPIEDVEHLDERRSALGMKPFEEYRKIMIERFGPKKN